VLYKFTFFHDILQYYSSIH